MLEPRFVLLIDKGNILFSISTPLCVGDSIVAGCTSRFLGTRKEIARKDILKIEIADDKKGIRYIPEIRYGK